jgi:hypothetical protein
MKLACSRMGEPIGRELSLVSASVEVRGSLLAQTGTNRDSSAPWGGYSLLAS